MTTTVTIMMIIISSSVVIVVIIIMSPLGHAGLHSGDAARFGFGAFIFSSA